MAAISQALWFGALKRDDGLCVWCVQRQAVGRQSGRRPKKQTNMTVPFALLYLPIEDKRKDASLKRCAGVSMFSSGGAVEKTLRGNGGFVSGNGGFEPGRNVLCGVAHYGNMALQ